MRIELTRVGSLVYLANHYTTRGTPVIDEGALVRTAKMFSILMPVLNVSYL